MKGNLKKILPVIFSILIFSSVFIFLMLKNRDDKKPTIQLSPQSYLYKDKFGGEKSYINEDITTEAFLTNIRVNNKSGVSEPKIICNPLNKKVLAISANDFSIKENSARIFISENSGEKWEQRDIVLSGKFKQSSYSDPWIDYDAEGNLFFVAVQIDLLNQGKEGICIARSDDNGKSWKTDFNFVDFNGKENIHIDRPKIYIDKSSINKNSIYITWVEVKGISSYIMFSKSTDGGNTFSAPFTIEKSNVEYSSIIGNLQGELFLVYLKDDDKILIRKSSDGGMNWNKYSSNIKIESEQIKSEDEKLIKNSNGIGIRINTEPAIVFSPKNELLITYSTSGSSADLSDIYFVKVRNSSSEFNQPVKVNSDKTNSDQFLPSVTVDESGNIFILYLDSRNDKNNINTETYVSVSTDGGLSFKDKKFSTKSFDPTLITINNYIGDYNSCVVAGNKLIGVWTDGRNNDFDLYAGVCEVSELLRNVNH